MVGGREMWWVLASGGQLDGVVNSMGDYVSSLKNPHGIPRHLVRPTTHNSSAPHCRLYCFCSNDSRECCCPGLSWRTGNSHCKHSSYIRLPHFLNTNSLMMLKSILPSTLFSPIMMDWLRSPRSQNNSEWPKCQFRNECVSQQLSGPLGL
jgi:hypothetical protein